MFDKESYEKHQQWYNKQFPDEEAKNNYFKHLLKEQRLTIGKWLQLLFFECLNPLLKQHRNTWLTLGDAYGFDAQYIASKKNTAIASDLNTDFLRVAKKAGIINEFCAQNAEAIDSPDNHFDYILCKESYHHFPKPYAALYEMARVAKKGFVIMEPQDPVQQMPLLLACSNLLSRLNQKLLQKVWKNRFSYEPVGNFVYKISSREIEKFAAGLNLPLVAFKYINPNFYFAGANEELATKKNKLFLFVLIKKSILDLFVKLGLIPSQVLVAIVFKSLPDDELLSSLKKARYCLSHIPKNPYL